MSSLHPESSRSSATGKHGSRIVQGASFRSDAPPSPEVDGKNAASVLTSISSSTDLAHHFPGNTSEVTPTRFAFGEALALTHPPAASNRQSEYGAPLKSTAKTDDVYHTWLEERADTFATEVAALLAQSDTRLPIGEKIRRLEALQMKDASLMHLKGDRMIRHCKTILNAPPEQFPAASKPALMKRFFEHYYCRGVHEFGREHVNQASLFTLRDTIRSVPDGVLSRSEKLAIQESLFEHGHGHSGLTAAELERYHQEPEPHQTSAGLRAGDPQRTSARPGSEPEIDGKGFDALHKAATSLASAAGREFISVDTKNAGLNAQSDAEYVPHPAWSLFPALSNSVTPVQQKLRAASDEREAKRSVPATSTAAITVANKRKEALATGAKAFKNLTRVYRKTKFDGPSLAQELEAVHNLPVREGSPLDKVALLKTLLEAGKDALDGNIVRQHFAELLRGPQADATRSALVNFLNGKTAKLSKPELIRQLLTHAKPLLDENLVTALRDQLVSVSEDCLDSSQKLAALMDLYRLGFSSLSAPAIKDHAKVLLSLPIFNSTIYTDQLRFANIGPGMAWNNVLLAASLFNLGSSSLSQSDLVELTTTILDSPDEKFSAKHKLYMFSALLVPLNPEVHTAAALAIRASAVIALPGDKLDAQKKDDLLRGIYKNMPAHVAAMGLLEKTAMSVPMADRLWLINWLYLAEGKTMASKEQVILAATKITSVTESDINARNILLNALIVGAKSIVKSDVVLTLPTGERIGPFPLPVVTEGIESVIVKGKDSKEK